MLTDKKGIPLSICLLLFITAVNTHDMKAATKTIDGWYFGKKKKKDIFFTETEPVS